MKNTFCNNQVITIKHFLILTVVQWLNYLKIHLLILLKTASSQPIAQESLFGWLWVWHSSEKPDLHAEFPADNPLAAQL